MNADLQNNSNAFAFEPAILLLEISVDRTYAPLPPQIHFLFFCARVYARTSLAGWFLWLGLTNGRHQQERERQGRKKEGWKNFSSAPLILRCCVSRSTQLLPGRPSLVLYSPEAPRRHLPLQAWGCQQLPSAVGSWCLTIH